MEYHIVLDNAYSIQQLVEVESVETMLTGTPSLFIHNNDAEQFFVTSPASTAAIVAPNNQACQCYVHTINNVLSPIPFPNDTAALQYPGVTYKKGELILNLPFERGLLPGSGDQCELQTVEEVMSRNLRTQPMLELLQAANVQFRSRDVTVFAAQQVALDWFAKQVGLAEWRDLLRLDRGVLTELAEMHLVSEKVSGEDLYNNVTLMAVNGEEIDLEPNVWGVRVEAPGNAADIVGFDVGSSCNIAVHEVSSVLIPYSSGIDELKQLIATFDLNADPTSQFSLNTTENVFDQVIPQVVIDTSISSSQLPIPESAELSPPLSPWDDLFPSIPTLRGKSPPPGTCKTVLQVLQERENLLQMADGILDAGLEPLLNSTSSFPLTLFALDKDALRSLIFSFGDLSEQLSRNTTMQQTLLGYHIVKGMWSTSLLAQNDTTLYTLVKRRNGNHTDESTLTLTSTSIISRDLQQQIIRISGNEDLHTSQAVVMDGDIEACNAYIHVLSSGLSPINLNRSANEGESFGSGIFRTTEERRQKSNPADQSSNLQIIPQLILENSQSQKCIPVMDLLDATREVSWFAVLLRDTGLASSLRDLQSDTKKQKITMFVPINQAFAGLEERIGISISKLIQTPQLAEELLQYHISKGYITKKVVKKAKTIMLTSRMMDKNILLGTQRAILAENISLYENSEDTLYYNDKVDTKAQQQAVNSHLDQLVVVDGLGGAFKVIVSDQSACNAVLHFIEGVLLPSTKE
eukprot:TRINITY_DN1503_c1_g1_i1.p1 TRINITY_DN1503_c1_g1~~TRINITY_DN1503_c1_g1_i1.p1  ORF type:complete len:880 (+),score=113.48 TRINITY_DN1503_c1_g1_i1:397-2640(+)